MTIDDAEMARLDGQPWDEVLDPAAAPVARAARPGMRLLRFEAHNWGTFDRQVWRLDVGGGNTLLTGQIGAGKSTIVDGLAILFNPPSQVSFNLAAGADRKERSLRTYVLGAHRNLHDDATGGSRPEFLRRAAGTQSSLLAVFGTASGRRVTIGMFLRFVNEASSPTWTYLLADADLAISDHLTGHRDTKAMRQHLRSLGVTLFESYGDYARAMTRSLGLKSQAALGLFNQTVAMKSVGNLTEFVRKHMLDAPDVAASIEQMLSHYADLTRAHDLVVDAREQIEALDAVARASSELDGHDQRLAANTDATDAIRPYVDATRVGLLTAAVEGLDRRIPELEGAKADAARRIASLDSRAQELRFQVRTSGGADLALADRDVTDARSRLEQVTARRGELEADATTVGIPAPADASGFSRFTAEVAARDGELRRQRSLDLVRQGEIVSALSRTKGELAALDAELAEAAQRASNVPTELAALRDRIAGAVGVDPGSLPFVGELLAVAEAETGWEAAIERLTRPFALSLLVPDELRSDVAAFVDDHHLGQRLVYYPVPDGSRAAGAPAPGSVAAKLRVRPATRFTTWVSGEVARRFVHACVADAAGLAGHERAVTRAGQVRDGARREKDDRHRADDRRRYVLGWDTASRRAALQASRPGLVAAVDQADAALRAEQDSGEARRLVELALARLSGAREFSPIDVAGAKAELAAALAHRDRLRSDPRLADLTARLERVEGELEGARGASEELSGELTATSREASRLRAHLARLGSPAVVLEKLATDLLTESVRSAGPAPLDVDGCDAWEERIRLSVTRRSSNILGQRNAAASVLVAAVGRYAARWPAHVVDVDTGHESARVDLLARRRSLVTDDLPRFEREFREQLERHAIHNIAVFARRLDNDAAAIRTRVAAINDALADVDYQPGTLIALTVEPTRDLQVREFRAQLRDITADAVGDPYSEGRFVRVRTLLDRFAGRSDHADEDARWTRHVADVRNWFAFAAEERTRDEGVVVEHYSDSDGKSGGQKERLAYTILAASLAYQYGLADPQAAPDAFRFAMIDEAFGRGSDDSTRFGLDMFERLGLQLLVVTPLQKIHTIEPYVEAVGYVEMKGDRSRLLSMTIEEFRARRAAHGAVR
ncbi:MAG: ATP-binding protein [Candidatus Nanopelagicales bacterium]